MEARPKITIITVVYNAQALIEKTIQSVLQQTYPFIEYIIVDGASSDGTLHLIEKYRSQLALVLSEKDKGIYDAMNKGLDRATGDYVLFLNAGDQLYDTDSINTVFAITSNADVYYGRAVVIDEKQNLLAERRLKPPAELNWKSLRFGMCVSHQAFIPKRMLCDAYDLNYHISSDIDWVIRVLKKSGKTVNVHEIISKFLEGGTSAKNKKTALKERFRIMVKHYGLVPTIFNHFYIFIRYAFHRLTRKSMT